MPRDGNTALPQPPEQLPPTRQQIELNQRNTIAAQWLDGEVDKAVLQNELIAARRRIAELEAQLAPVEPG